LEKFAISELPLVVTVEICFHPNTRRMSAIKIFIAAAGILAAAAGLSSAQTNFITVTNYVTVTITNVVVITNPATAAPPAAAAATPAATATPAAAPATPPAAATNAPALSHAQIKYPWKNSVSAGLTLARGNTDTTLISADYSTTRKTPEDELGGNASLAYGEQNSKQTADNYKGDFQWNHLFTDRFYAYSRVEGLRDYIADIDYRFTLGPGLGYYVIKNKTTSFALGGGVNYEAQSQGGQANTFATLRVADRFEYKLSDSTRIWQNFELLPEVDRFDNYLANFELGAEAALYKSFSLKTVFSDNYDNRPAAAHEKNDVRLVAGVGYKF
jgi:putative salt-induced outer membrane protein YdiY